MELEVHTIRAHTLHESGTRQGLYLGMETKKSLVTMRLDYVPHNIHIILGSIYNTLKNDLYDC